MSRAILNQVLALCVIVLATIVAGANPVGSALTDRAEAASRKPRGVQFIGSQKEVNQRAATEGKLILAYFAAQKDPNCVRMSSKTFGDEYVAIMAEAFLPRKIDIAKHPAYTAQYRVTRVPTVVFIDSSGKEVARKENYVNEWNFIKLMAATLARNSLSRMEEDARAMPNDLGQLTRIAVVYAAAGNKEKAQQVADWVRHKDPQDTLGYDYLIKQAMMWTTPE